MVKKSLLYKNFFLFSLSFILLSLKTVAASNRLWFLVTLLQALTRPLF
jgi:hypothetical protein